MTNKERLTVINQQLRSAKIDKDQCEILVKNDLVEVRISSLEAHKITTEMTEFFEELNINLIVV